MALSNFAQKYSLSSLPFLTGTFSEVTEFIIQRIKSKSATIILPCSLNDLATVSQNQASALSYQSVDICTTDGMPLVWLINLKTHQKIERVYGPDLMVALCQSEDIQKLKHVFYGSSKMTLKKLVRKIKQISPQLDVVETISPPMRQLSNKEEQKYLRQIQRDRPDLLWIGLSSPLQVELAARWKKFFPRTTILCVGAAFDFVAENKPVAPHLMKKFGLEWFFRLTHEPKRLWKRYLITIPQFLLRDGLKLLLNP